MDKIRITFFLQNLEVGGAERSIVRLANALDKNLYEVSFLLCLKKGALIQSLNDGIKITDLRVSHVSFSLLGVIKYFKNEKPDIVVSALDHINVINVLASRFCHQKPKIIITERSTFSRVSTHSATKIRNKLISKFLMPVLAKVFYKKADSIICVSKGVKDDISKVIGNLSTLTVIYNPVIEKNFSDLIKEEVENEEFRKSLLRVIAVGRLTKAKDYPTMLKAFSLVLKDVPADLMIIGDGEEKANLKKIIKNLGLSNKVHLLGAQENPLKFVSKSDVFVLSSILEGFPNVLVEAMACEVPVVSTDCQSGPNEIIKDGVNGFLVQVGNVDALAKTIVKLLKDPLLREKISKEGEKCSEQFSAKRSVDLYGEVFLNILKK